MTSESVTYEQRLDRFQINVDGRRAGVAQFLEDGKQRIFFHTEVEPEHGGKGLGSMLVQHALEQTRADGMRIVPVCPYVGRFLSENNEFEDLVDTPTAQTIDFLKERLD